MPNIRINDVPQRIQYVATAPTQSVFAIPFPFFADTDIVAYQDDVLLVDTTDYSLTGAGTASGGTLTLVVPAATGVIITILGALPVDRTSIYSATISNLTGSDLNNDFNSDVVMIKQLQTQQQFLQLSYPPYAEVSQDLDVTIDREIPILAAGQIWRKNDLDTAIEAVGIPAFPVGSFGGNFPDNYRVVRTNITTGENDIEQTNITAPDLNTLSTASGDLNLTATDALRLEGVEWPDSGAAAGLVPRLVNATTLEYAPVPTSTLPTIPGRLPVYDSTVGSITDSLFAQNGTNLLLPADPTVNLAAATKQYVDAATAGSVVSVVGTANQIDVDNSDPNNPVLTISSTFVAPGTVTLDADPTLALEAATKQYVDGLTEFAVQQDGSPIFGADSVGTDDYAITLSPVPTAYVVGMVINFTAGTANTTGATLNVNALGAVPITKLFNQALATGDILAGQVVTVIYDGTNFQMQSSPAQTSAPANVVLQDGSPIFGADAGVTDSYSITLNPAPAAYNDGMVVNFSANTLNTGAATLNVNGLGAIPIKKLYDQDLEDGDIEAGQIVTVIYDGTNFQMQSQLAQTSSASGDAMKSEINQTTHGFSVGDVLYLNSTTYTLALADDVVTAEAVGIVSAVADVDNFTLTTGGKITGLSGLTAGDVYFLSDSVAGELTATPPSTVGYVVKPLLIADTTTSGYVFNMRGDVVSTNAVGDWEYLGAATASNDALLEFSQIFSSEYSQYVFMFKKILPATTNTILQCQIGTGAGPTYTVTGYDYEGQANTGGSTAVLTGDNQAQANFNTINPSSVSGILNSGVGLCGELTVIGPNGSSETVSAVGQNCYPRSTDALIQITSHAWIQNAAAIYTSIKFYMSSGNITSGTIEAYGLRGA